MNFDILWQRAVRFRAELALISGLSLISSLATLAVPWLAGQLLGDVIQGALSGTSQILLLLVCALVSLTAFNIGARIVSEIASQRILTELRLDVYEHVQLMPMEFHDQNSHGDMLSLMTYEARNLSGFLASTLANVPSLLLTAGGAVIVLFLLDPYMAIVVPILIPVFYIVMKLLGRRMRIIARKVRQAEIALITRADTDLEMTPAIKAFAGEQYHLDLYDLDAQKARQLAVSQSRITSFIGPTVALIAALAAIAVLIAGSDALARGDQTPGELFAFLLYAALLTRPVGGLADLYGQFQIAKGTLARLEAVLSKDAEAGYSQTERIKRTSGAIEFEDVSFGYARRPQVLDRLSLSIKPAEVVALTGDNGVGKSTLIRLLMRFYLPDSGRILLDGVDTAELQVQSLRQQFGYVPQRALLFDGTIEENIVFGQLSDDDPDRAATIKRAVRLAQATDFINKLPRGLQTIIGDDGVRLSGGQRQRIALARALLRDPPIYILDEATSMYDLESEAAFVEDCVDTLRDRTVIIITHRPASLALAHRILKVTEHGIEEQQPEKA